MKQNYKFEKQLLIQISRLHWKLPDSIRDKVKNKCLSLAQEPLDWDFLYSMARVHRIENLLAHYSLEYNLNNFSEKNKNILTGISNKNSISLLVLGSILKALPDNIKVIPIKGISFLLLKSPYPETGLRYMDDIDLLVKPENIEPVLSTLKIKGFKIPEQYKNLHKKHFHYILIKKIDNADITLELHFRLAQPNRFNIKTEDMFRDAEMKLNNIPNLLFLSKPHNLYYLLFHTGFHYIFERLQWLGELEYFIRNTTVEKLEDILSRASDEGTRTIIMNTLIAVSGLYGLELPESIIDHNIKLKDKSLLEENRLWEKDELRNRLFQFRYGFKTMDNLKNKFLWSKEFIINKLRKE